MNDQVEVLKEDYKTAQITAKDIFLPPFKDNVTNEESDRLRQDYIEKEVLNSSGSENQASTLRQRAMQSIYDSYLSTPNFVNRLCEISDGLIGLQNKRPYLMTELLNVNK